MQRKILLIDGNSLIFRAYFASAYGNKKILTTSQGVPTNAVYSFTNMLAHLLTNRTYFDVKVAFDKGKKTFRHQKLDNYKANRAQTPAELIVQFPIARELLTAAGIDWFELDDYEADDIIGTLAKKIEREIPDSEVEILTSDKDMFQLISAQTKILLPNSGTTDLVEFGLEELAIRWSCQPKQVPDLKGLMGDPSDNLKGVSGIGEKTAIKLISEYHDLEGIYEHLDQITGATHQKLVNGQESAFLSRELATIETNFEIPDLEFRPLKITRDRLSEFLLKYEMFSIVKRLGLKVEKPPQKKVKVQILTHWLPEYEAENNAIYVQSLNDNYHRDKIVGIGISNEHGNFYLDKSETTIQLSFFEENTLNSQFDEDFNRFLKNKQLKKQTYDLKKTVTLLKNAGYEVVEKSFDFDMMVACYDLDPNLAANFTNHLQLIKDQVDPPFLTDEEVFGKGVKKTGKIDLPLKADFIGAKAYLIARHQKDILTQLKKNDQLDLYEKIDFPFIFVLLKMEETGVLIDRQELETQTQVVLKKIQKLEKQSQVILTDVPTAESLNLSSPKQLQQLLFEDLQLPNFDKGSTSKETLERLLPLHPLINILLEHRKYSKLYSTYLKGFEKYIFTDGRVHTIFNQTLTNTGRLSSMEPNLQNISVRQDEQKEVRKIFVTTPGQEFFSFDYSQIELRVLAQMVPERKLLEIFAQNRDVHAETAREIFNLDSGAEITSEMRRTAKVFNFGIIYGLSDFGLSRDLNISLPEAKKMITNYYEKFPDLLAFKKTTIAFAKEHGYVLTAANRKRNIPELSSKNYQIRQFGERAAVNMPVQGTAADLLKVAMNQIFDFLKVKQFKSQMVAQIHDEIILEIPSEEQEIVCSKVVELMGKAYGELLKIVEKPTPKVLNLAVTSSQGKNWRELK